MSKPGFIYRLNWQAFHETSDIQQYIDISDNDNLIADGDTATVYDLKPAGEPARLSVIDNNDDPFNPIRAKQLTITFANESLFNLSTFASGSDQRWSVHYYTGDDAKTIFKGFLVLDDIQEPLLPLIGYEVVLTATDNLGLLKDVKLTNNADLTPKGYYSLIKIISLGLKRTGLELPIMCSFNIKNSGLVTDISAANSTDEHFFSQNCVDVKTFEEEINKLGNIYDILSKILGHEAALFQSKGKWWILRTDEVEDPTRNLYITHFDSEGDFVGNLGEINFSKGVGIDQDIKFSERATLVRVSRPKKEVRLDFNYQQPTLPYNSNFEVGDLLQVISPTESRFLTDGWFLGKGYPGSFAAPNCSTYTKRIYNAFGQEDERYVVITSPLANNAITNKLVCQNIPVHEGDKFNINVDFRFSAGITGTTRYYNILNVVLNTEDGKWWLHGRDESGNSALPKWYDTSSWTVNTNKGQQYFDFNSNEHSDWDTQTTEVTPLPGDGKLYIWLNSLNTSGGSDDDLDIHYNNLDVTYIPKLNGCYKEIKSQYHRTWQDGDYKAVIKDEVYISDSPKKSLKGALQIIDSWSSVYSGSVSFGTTSFDISGFVVDKFEVGQIIKISGTVSNNKTTRVTAVAYHVVGTLTTVTVEDSLTTETHSATIESPVFVLADGYYNAAVFPSGPPNSDYIHPYGHIQLFDVWNQYKNGMRVLEATLQGCDLEKLDSDSLPNYADLINKWWMLDASTHLVNRRFLLLSFDQDHYRQGWRGTFREVVNLTVPKDYTNHEFKYLDQ